MMDITKPIQLNGLFDALVSVAVALESNQIIYTQGFVDFNSTWEGGICVNVVPMFCLDMLC